ncbi:hypothetical protein LT17_00402 [Pseudomonas aeruginosa]|nr:hypothetical protein LT17_00402 [Pseudomonas aeruginosa]CAB5675032.1 Uncharacterised protein [Pseudomonas aeruginosa]
MIFLGSDSCESSGLMPCAKMTRFWVPFVARAMRLSLVEPVTGVLCFKGLVQIPTQAFMLRV